MKKKKAQYTPVRTKDTSALAGPPERKKKTTRIGYGKGELI